MAKVDPQVIAQINADPDVRAAMVDGWGHPLTESTNHDVSRALFAIHQKYGNIPVELKNGQWRESTGESWVDKAFQYGIPGAIGGIVAAPALAGLLGGGGGGAAGSAAAGVDAAGMGSGGAIGTAGSGGLLGTLGSIGKFADPLRDLGSDLTGASAGLASGRRYDAQANAQAAGFNLGAPSVRTSQVARGDLLSRMQDAPPTGDPRIDKFSGGGLRPSAFGPDTHAAGDALKRQAMQALLSGSDRLQPSQAGVGEDVLAGAGLGANVLGTLGKIGKISRWF